MDVERMQVEFIDLVKTLLDEGMLDNQFKVIQDWMIDDVNDPSFVIVVLTHYLSESVTILDNISNALEQTPNVDFEQLYFYAIQIKEASLCVGAPKIANLSYELQRCCEERIIGGCIRCDEIVKNEIAVLNEKLQEIVKLELDIIEANGTIPPVMNL